MGAQWHVGGITCGIGIDCEWQILLSNIGKKVLFKTCDAGKDDAKNLEIILCITIRVMLILKGGPEWTLHTPKVPTSNSYHGWGASWIRSAPYQEQCHRTYYS